MANAEQLSILKRGVEAWNGWRARNMYVYADLNGADLNGTDLGEADLRIAHLRRANLFRADLRGAKLNGADLSDADLREADLSGADLFKANLNGAKLSRAFVRDANLQQANLLAATLRGANFSHANLGEANLTVANLDGADFNGANLSRANLTKAHLAGAHLRLADLSEARLTGANLTAADLLETRFIQTELTGTDFSKASMGRTVYVNSDLSQAIGLGNVHHRGPSHISMDTFALSVGKIPAVFLCGCGLSDADIEYTKLSSPELDMQEIDRILFKIHQLRAVQMLQISPLFVSYSEADSGFVDKVGDHLAQQGIRYWREVHEKKAGRAEKLIDRVVRQSPRVLLILSEHSLKDVWIEQELQEARKLEKELGHAVLCPVAVDDSWKDGHMPKRMVEQITEYDVFDFSAWKDNHKFDGVVRKMIERLDFFKKG